MFEVQTVEFEDESSGQAYAPLNDENLPKKYNNRLPATVLKTQVGSKMFSYGWKFNMFNETVLQSNKAIAAISVIFAQLFFSLASIQSVGSEH